MHRRSSRSTRKRFERALPKDHEDRIAGKGITSLSHYNLVHKFFPMLRAMTIPDGKAAMDKEWEKLEKLPAWHMAKVNNQKEVILESQKEQRTIHFATLMDKDQKYKGWVVLRGDVVKDDSGSHAAVTEQCPSASQVTAAKCDGCHRKATGQRRTGSRRSVTLHSGFNERRSEIAQNSKVKVS